MQFTDTVVIGAGQAGLAVSRLLTAGAVDHVVLDRGRIAERWLSQRWDSLRLLTPNWMTRLPGWSYRGDDPDGFMRAADLAAYLDAYAAQLRGPGVDPGVDGRVGAADRRRIPRQHLVRHLVGPQCRDRNRLLRPAVGAGGRCTRWRPAIRQRQRGRVPQPG